MSFSVLPDANVFATLETERIRLEKFYITVEQIGLEFKLFMQVSNENDTFYLKN